jgi:hypothetical protein
VISKTGSSISNISGVGIVVGTNVGSNVGTAVAIGVDTAVLHALKRNTSNDRNNQDLFIYSPNYLVSVIIDTKDCDYILPWKGILDRIILIASKLFQYDTEPISDITLRETSRWAIILKLI